MYKKTSKNEEENYCLMKTKNSYYTEQQSTAPTSSTSITTRKIQIEPLDEPYDDGVDSVDSPLSTNQKDEKPKVSRKCFLRLDLKIQ